MRLMTGDRSMSRCLGASFDNEESHRVTANKAS